MALTVVIDAGHGGNEVAGGSSPNHAIGPNGLLEKNLTLDLARRMRSLLARELRVVLTREDDHNLSLIRRAGAARETDAAVFLSLHFNGARDQHSEGPHPWIARNASPATLRLAESVAHELALVTGAHEVAPSRRDLGVLLPERLGPNTRACLVEIGYLSNDFEAARLEGDSYRQEIAGALANAVLAHLKEPSSTALQTTLDCGRDVAVTDTMALLVSSHAPLPVTSAEIKRVSANADALDDYKSICAIVPRNPETRLLIFFHGNKNYVTVAVHGDVPAKVDPSQHSRVPRWTNKVVHDIACKIPAACIKYGFETLAATQKLLSPESTFTGLAVKNPVVLVPEDGELTTGEHWSVPPSGQYGKANDGRPSGPGTARLQDLVTDCYEHLRCLPNPAKQNYLASGMTNRASWVSNIGRVYLSGHSGGGKPLVESAGADMVLVTPSSVMGVGGRAVDLWLFDCTYGFGIHNYVNFCTNWRNAGRLAYGPESTRFVCVYIGNSQTESEANQLRIDIAAVMKVDAKSLLQAHDSDQMTSKSMIDRVIPALSSSPVIFIRTRVGHPDIPGKFIPLLLRTAAS